jgi:VWFA-related protein
MPALIPRGTRFFAFHHSVILVAVVLSAFVVAILHSSRTVHASTVLQAGQPTLSAPDGGGRLTVLVFDTTALPRDLMDKAVASSLAFVDRDIVAADRVAIVTISPRLEVVNDFTSDHQALRSGLSSVRLQTGVQNSATPPTAAADATAPGDARLRGLTTLCTTLGSLPQRKAVMYFSGGIAGGGTDSQAELNAATNACRRGNVLIYAVDARGLAATPAASGQGGLDRFNGAR